MDRKAQQRSPVYFKVQAGNKREAGYLWTFWNNFGSLLEPYWLTYLWTFGTMLARVGNMFY